MPAIAPLSMSGPATRANTVRYLNAAREMLADAQVAQVEIDKIDACRT